MRIRVISLPHSHERRAYMALQLDPLGVDYSFFNAVDGELGRGAFAGCDERQFLLNIARPIAAGEIGCFASHRLLWQECALTGHPMLILEDDAGLSSEFPDALRYTESHIDDYGFLRFQSARPSRRAKMTIVESGSPLSVVRYTHYPLGTMAYALTSAVARAFLSASSVMTLPVDAFIKKYWIHRQPLYGFFPGIVAGGPQKFELTIEGRVRHELRPAERSMRQLRKLREAIARTRFNLTRTTGSPDSGQSFRR